MDKKLYYRYWGKARKEKESGATCHLLPYHCLDVAAVAEVMLGKNEKLFHKLAGLLGVPVGQFKRLALFFIALHDIGKFGEGFQNLEKEILRLLQSRDSNTGYNARHDSLGYVLWREHLWEAISEKLTILPIPDEEYELWQDVFEQFIEAVTGHHGRPPGATDRASNRIRLDGRYSQFRSEDKQAAEEFAVDAAALFLDELDIQAIDPQPLLEAVKSFSWWFAGFTVLCDWVGSQEGYFGYKSEVKTLEEYWAAAKDNAERAVSESGLLPCGVAAEKPIEELFVYITEKEPFIPTPLQREAASLPLADEPQLFILEDVTGSGKTEAALVLVHRLMSQGLADGFYIGLPTMATADAMYRRARKFYRRLFGENTTPSLTLAHSALKLSKTFRELKIGRQNPQSDADYGYEERSATAHCSAWFGDSAKRALLAQVGVGTIDQCLTAILPVKYQSLRLLGMLNKVLVVDEVHACDAYMHELLKTLLTFHAQAGGSAILLSATLPQKMRRELADAYREGRGLEAKTLKETEYPLLTKVAVDIEERRVDTRDSVERQVDVRMVHSFKEAADFVVEQSKTGRCVCWICNTVFDARRAYLYLINELPKEKLRLFHARYAMGDRFEIEKCVNKSFGKESKPEKRQGQVLVATQVIEQSLDLDFDVMVTDLAPVDLIIQRAGRLCRHIRNKNGKFLGEGEDGRGTPELVINTPVPADNPASDWFEKRFPKASGIYRDHGRLWLTARLLAEKKGFGMPDDARELIESVYGEAVDIPNGLQTRTDKTVGEDMSARSVADLNALDLPVGYSFAGGEWSEDAEIPTRLGESTSELYLAKWDGEKLKPWVEKAELPWEMSRMRVRRYQVADAVDANPVLKKTLEETKEKLPGKGRWSILIPMARREDGLWSGRVKNGNGETVKIFYDEKQGLIFERELQETGDL